MSEEQNAAVEQAAPRRPVSPLRRLGCVLLLILWFAFILLPCALVMLAQQQEIVISQGDLPGEQIRIWLIMEIEQRGLGIASTARHAIDGAQCVQTDVRFALWQGEGEAVSYCECYTRGADEETWLFVSQAQGACVP
ncbi:MAG: hypothetical protein HXY40_06695 [Chloroflexi bacterium]|nr:hypothetical protein [Chloroflexota bacterium]